MRVWLEETDNVPSEEQRCTKASMRLLWLAENDNMPPETESHEMVSVGVWLEEIDNVPSEAERPEGQCEGTARRNW